MALLEVTNLGIAFGGLQAVAQLDMKIEKGHLYGLIGPNGAGKTTVFNLLTNVYQPTRGSILIDGMPTAGKKTYQVNRMGVARTFQNIRLFSDMTVLENVMIGRHCRTKAGIWGALTRNPATRREEQESIDISYSLLETVHLQDLWNEKACNLAYGAQRRLEIARALATEPRMLLLDEPAAGMNPQESIELMHFIQAIRDHFDLTILLIEHDMKVVMGVCQYIWVMEYGALIAHGDPDAIRSNPEVIRAYLGEDVV